MAAALKQRNVIIDGQSFIDSRSNETVVFAGPNVVVKGPPYLPRVSGDKICNDTVDDTCTATGSCTTCYTFNEADIAHIKAMGWNSIRLGVTWAGAQPEDTDSLDTSWLRNLHEILSLTDKHDLHVVLDNHGDMVGSLGCGNGVPAWFQKKAAPELVGKPLTTGFPFSLVPSMRIEDLDGYDHCGSDEAKWAAYAGDPNYNLLNDCCTAMNSPNPGAIGYSKISQKTMNYMLQEGPGRDDFVRMWRLLAEAVVDHPSAIAFELDNEPMSIWRGIMYETWRAAAEAINAVIPDMAVSIQDTAEGTVMPAFVVEHFGTADLDIKSDTIDFIKESNTLFYAWHWYGQPSDPAQAVKNAQAKGNEWNVPTFATEMMSCDAWKAAQEAGISRSYWHYSSYCNTGPSFASNPDSHTPFGACILGWAAGTSSYTCD